MCNDDSLDYLLALGIDFVMTKVLNNIKCFLLDMDGTIHLSGRPIEGAADAVARMRAQAEVYFLTNSTLFSRSDQAQKLRNIGIPCVEDEIYTSATATADYLNEHYKGKRVFVLGTSVLKRELRGLGIKVVEQKPDLVVVSFDNKINFAKLTKTCDFIRGNIPFLATHPDFNYPIYGGYWPDNGANLAFIEACTHKKPFIICGKPYAPMGEGARRRVNCEPHEVAMVGDRIMTDIVLAKNNGFVSILVLTGEATLADHEKSSVKADIILPSINDWDGAC